MVSPTWYDIQVTWAPPWSLTGNLWAPPLATSAAPLCPRSQISGREPLRRRQRLNMRLPQVSFLELYLNLSHPHSLMNLSESTINMGRHELGDICLEHAQVPGHLFLLRNRKLRVEKIPLREHLSDLRHRLIRMSQI